MLRNAWLTALAVLACACAGESAGDAPEDTPSFTLNVHGQALRVSVGSSTTLSISIGRDAGRPEQILVGFEGLPSGLDSDTVALGPSDSYATLTLRANDAQPSTSMSIDVVARAGEIERRHAIGLTVSEPKPDPTGDVEVVSIDLGSSHFVRDVAAAPDGALVVLLVTDRGLIRVARLTPELALDPAFGNGGVAMAGSGLPNSLLVDAAGVHVVGAQDPSVLRLDATGAPDHSFGNLGVVTLSEAVTAVDMAPNGAGYTIAGSTGEGVYVATLSADGEIVEFSSIPSNLFGPVAAAFDERAVYFADNWSDEDGAPRGTLYKAGRDGIADLAFGDDALASLRFATWSTTALDSDGRVLACGTQLHTELFEVPLVTRWSSRGQQDLEFGTSAGLALPPADGGSGVCTDVAADGARDGIFAAVFGVGSGFHRTVELHRLLGDGQRDLAFGDNGALRFEADSSGALHVAGARVWMAWPDGAELKVLRIER